jgi:hypothetical protein
MSLGDARHQKPGQPGRAGAGHGEAGPEAASDEAALARHAQTDCGAGDLLGQALARENVARAWKRVKANKGSAGVDGRTVQDTGEYLKDAWPDIRQRLLDGSYKPEPVRRVGIPKPGGGTRELWIPTSRDDMRAVLARSLELYQGRNGGVLPKRLVIHKTTAFKKEEIDGAFDALIGVPEIECIEVGAASCWRGVWLIETGRENPPYKPAMYPVPRGTTVIRSSNSALVWVAGNAPEASTKGDYYQGGKSIPKPLQLVRHAGKGSLELIAHEALALTKMDWNNDALYDPVPVSIRYSQRLARTIANVQDLPRSVYPYRLFM